jgi:hypothetical protein
MPIIHPSSIALEGPKHNPPAQNPLTVELTIDHVNINAGLKGAAYISLGRRFSHPVIVPSLGHAKSGDTAASL